MSFLPNIPWWLAVAAVVVILGVAGYFREAIKVAYTNLSGPVTLVFLAAVWSMPVVLGFIGWIMPSFNQPATWPLPDKVANGFNYIAILFVIGIVISLIVNATAPTKLQVQRNLVVSALWMYAILRFNQYWFGGAPVEFWAVAPEAYVVIELIGGIILGVHNAWNKNPSQISRDSTKV